MPETPHLSANEKRLVERLQAKGNIIARMSSDSETAIRLGNGYVYFSIPDGKHVKAETVTSLAGKGMLTEQDDCLFAGGGQTLRLADPLPAFTSGRRRKAK